MPHSPYSIEPLYPFINLSYNLITLNYAQEQLPGLVKRFAFAVKSKKELLFLKSKIYF